MKQYVTRGLRGIIFEDYYSDIKYNNVAKNIYNKIRKSIDDIDFELLGSDDFITLSNGKRVNLGGVKFNLSQIDKKHNLDIIFSHVRRGTLAAYKNNKLIFFILESPYLKKSFWDDNNTNQEFSDDYLIGHYSRLVKLRFSSWVSLGVFTHEFIHYLDDKRYSPTYQLNKGGSYYNSPEEYNAYVHEILSYIFSNKKRLGELDFNNFLKSIIGYDSKNVNLFQKLNRDYQKKFVKRMYKIYIGLRDKIGGGVISEGVIKKTLYHGSRTPNLKQLTPYTNKVHSIPPCIFLTNKKSVARDYGDIIYKCKINCENILEIDVHGESFHNYLSFESQIYSAFNNGYDCVLFKNIMDSQEPGSTVPLSDIYVVFDSKNVKILQQNGG